MSTRSTSNSRMVSSTGVSPTCTSLREGSSVTWPTRKTPLLAAAEDADVEAGDTEAPAPGTPGAAAPKVAPPSWPATAPLCPAAGRTGRVRRMTRMRASSSSMANGLVM